MEHNKMAPTVLSVCVSNFQKGFIADTRTNWLLFLMEDENDNHWAYIQIFANDWSTSISASMGGVSVPGGKYLPIYFSQSWMRVCISLDMINGTGRIAANGQLITDSSYPDLIGIKDKRPSKFKTGQKVQIMDHHCHQLPTVTQTVPELIRI